MGQKKELEAPKKSEFQKFETVTMRRTDLKGASYNPRKIDEAAKKKLRNNLKRVGLLQPIVMNKRTGNIVSGHQRIAVMDSLERTQNYLLDVAVVDLDEKTEKEQVIFFNNEFAMGSFDIPLLDELVKEINIENAGFEVADLTVLLPSFEAPRSEPEMEQTKKVSAVAEDIQKLKQARKDGIAATIANHPEDANVEFFLVLVFRDAAGTDAFLDTAKMNRGEKYISGEALTTLLKKAQAALDVNAG